MHSKDSSQDSPPSSYERCWYAVFTQCHHEQRVAHQLEFFNIECFIPRYLRISQWKDRVVRLEQPLFPTYIFVRVMREEVKQVLQARGTVKLVGPAGRPFPIPDKEISCLQFAVQSYPTEPADYFSIGERVRIEAAHYAELAVSWFVNRVKRELQSQSIRSSARLLWRSILPF